MIHFSRSEGEALIIGKNITVTVLEIDGEDVVLQIDYPEGTEIENGELAELVSFSS